MEDLAADAADPLLEMRSIGKTFPGVIALDNVSFTLMSGEVHVLLGENGAGKSTLLKILSGAYRRDTGDIVIGGVIASIGSPRDAQNLGIATIYQELSLVPHLTVAENILLGHEPSRLGWIERRRLHDDARRALADVGAEIDPYETVDSLGIAEQQVVEIAKALYRRARVIAMDEPTSALTSREIERLFAVVRRITAAGVGVIYISHRMRELSAIGDRVTVLRDGRNVGTFPLNSISVGELVALMANREVREHYPRRRRAAGDELLRVDGVRTAAGASVSITVCRGEIVGLAGLLGAGRTRLARTIAGANPTPAGMSVSVNGVPLSANSPRSAIRAGIGLLPEDRRRQGLVMNRTVCDNIGLPSLARWSRSGVVSRRRECAEADRLVRELRIKTPSIDELVVRLSGGTQQKVVLARWLAAGASVLVMDEPTRGIDVGAKVEIYELMNRLTDAGTGILMISSELPEVLGMSDRIYVMRGGLLEAEFAAGDATEEKVLHAALGLAS